LYRLKVLIYNIPVEAEACVLLSIPLSAFIRRLKKSLVWRKTSRIFFPSI